MVKANAWVLRQIESDVVSHMIMKITAFFTQFVCSLPTEIGMLSSEIKLKRNTDGLCSVNA